MTWSDRDLPLQSFDVDTGYLIPNLTKFFKNLTYVTVPLSATWGHSMDQTFFSLEYRLPISKTDSTSITDNTGVYLSFQTRLTKSCSLVFLFYDLGSLFCEPTEGTEKCILLSLRRKEDLESDF